MLDDTWRGLVLGPASGVVVGTVAMLSDVIAYSRNGHWARVARPYRSPLLQLGAWLVVSLFYGAVQGAVFAWVAPALPAGVVARGILFGAISFVILSRHFAEGYAFLNPSLFPTGLLGYLTVEFVVIYVLQGVLISAGMGWWR